MEFKLRQGKKEDIPAILNLIKKLAKYENAPEEVSITEKQLEADGFGINPFYKVIIAETENKPVGLALYYNRYSTWKGKCIYLEDIIVIKEYRRQGIGSMLMEELILISHREGAKRLEWQVLDWNLPAIEFYKKYNVDFDNSWVNCRITDQGLAELAERRISRNNTKA